MEFTARNLNVAKNTRKAERVIILTAWDTNKEGLEAFLSRFYDIFLTTGNGLHREEMDQGGPTFWIDVAAAFGSEFAALISDDTVYEGIDAS
ncbi:hypothetical protein PHMEG_00031665 [Phytophthora megakarya]|uniref:Uncharacterized protein n=1 Tax=Phytophthora megakarya TaxID=4795 RepID=A0A225UXK9_9STRA|nr:hypothetical protein PHMEG_00031665 [Phytophthora megakarya]